MKRTTIFIPEALEADLDAYARVEKKSVAAVVREAVAVFLESKRKPFRLPAFTGQYGSGRSDLSERSEELVFADLRPQDGRARTPTRRRRKR